MNLHFKDSYLELSSTHIMGNLDLDPKNPLSVEDIREIATDYLESGASLIEFSVEKFTHSEVTVEPEQAAAMLCQAIGAVKDMALIPAVFTSSPVVMEAAVKAGAQMVVDPLALRAPGALETAARLKVVVCLMFDQSIRFDEEQDVDPIAAVSEFFYERLDACMNAKIERQRIILDPLICVHNSMEYRLKMLGRLKTFNSFGLPLSCSLPRMVEDKQQEQALAAVLDSNMAETVNRSLSQDMSIVTAVALFAETQGIRLIRTSRVYELALALDTWHALNLSARPFKLSRAIRHTIRHFSKKKKKPAAPAGH